MDNSRLEEAVILLRQIRSELHDVVDARVTKGLDEAIELLERVGTVEAERRSALIRKALTAIGDTLRLIPAIKSLLDSLM